MLEVPSGMILLTLGGRAFCYAAPKLWNNLPSEISSLEIFLNKLLICSRVFVTFILLFIIYYHFYFIFKSFYLLVNFISF